MRILVIEDDGPGLDGQARQRVVRRGVRMDEQVPGSGLGLAIVGDITASYGGDFSVHDAEGGGLRACLSLPCAH